jgi:hypothetical protein
METVAQTTYSTRFGINSKAGGSHLHELNLPVIGVAVALRSAYPQPVSSTCDTNVFALVTVENRTQIVDLSQRKMLGDFQIKREQAVWLAEMRLYRPVPVAAEELTDIQSGSGSRSK